MPLENKCILITGANGGLGSVVTRAFLQAGACVAGVSRSMRAAELPHQRFMPVTADIGSAAGAQRALDAAVEDTTPADVERMLDINYRSALTLARVMMPYFRAQGAGRFAAIGSRIVEVPAPLTAGYSASKAALVSLMRTLDEEGRPAGIRATVLLPATLDESVTQLVARELLEFAA